MLFIEKLIFTTRGLNGGLIFLSSKSTQLILFKKNGCLLIASSPPCDTTHPNRLFGFFVINFKLCNIKINLDTNEIKKIIYSFKY